MFGVRNLHDHAAMFHNRKPIAGAISGICWGVVIWILVALISVAAYYGLDPDNDNKISSSVKWGAIAGVIVGIGAGFMAANKIDDAGEKMATAYGGPPGGIIYRTLADADDRSPPSYASVETKRVPDPDTTALGY